MKEFHRGTEVRHKKQKVVMAVEWAYTLRGKLWLLIDYKINELVGSPASQWEHLDGEPLGDWLPLNPEGPEVFDEDLVRTAINVHDANDILTGKMDQ